MLQTYHHIPMHLLPRRTKIRALFLVYRLILGAELFHLGAVGEGARVWWP